jgi:antitoxin ParD1/3/4
LIETGPHRLEKFAKSGQFGILGAHGGRILNISLSSDLQNLVHEKIASGQYSSASEVVREALRLMDDRDQMLALQKQDIRSKIDAGVASLRAGRSSDGDDYFDRIEALIHKSDEREGM